MIRYFAFAIAMLMAAPLAAQQTAYQLQPGDVLDVSIWGQDNMRRQVVVLPDGAISYPLAGHMNVVGMTAVEAENELKRRLVRGGYFLEPPQLTVSVTETLGNQLYVMGRVRQPGAIAAGRRLTVVQALSLAGGLDEFADRRGIIVIRRNGEAQQVVRIDYAAVHSGRDLSTNVVLEPGDVVVVPEARLF
jgi:polysaccharide biosynthesis/export protein